MSAGTGIEHSEFNASKTDPVHLLQIWIMPNQRNVTPSYEQKTFPVEEKQGKLLMIACDQAPRGDVRPRPSSGAALRTKPPITPVTIQADASLYVSALQKGEKVHHALASTRHAWLQVAKGSVELNGQKLEQGDGASASNEATLEIRAATDAEILLFDLA